MGFADIHGRARVNPKSPEAFGVCDTCGVWYNHSALLKQVEWQGPKLAWVGYLVCSRCYDDPQPQLRPIRLPRLDPAPVINPRPPNFPTIDMPSGFTQYVMWADGQPLNFAVVLADGDGNEILDNNGQPIILEIGSDGPALLGQLNEMTGIAVPGNINSWNGTIAAQSVAQQLIPANAARSYIAIFNPCGAPMGVSVGTASLGVAPTIDLGAGSCLFWATAQGYGQPYTGAMTIVSPIAGIPFYSYEA